MLPKRTRARRADFDELRKHGRRITGSCFSLSYHQKSTAPGGVCGVVVSKKAGRTAVTRHRIRRQAYAVVRALWPHLVKPFTAALYATPKAATCTPGEISDEIAALFTRAGLLSQEHDALE